jgi:VanZ family protein
LAETTNTAKRENPLAAQEIISVSVPVPPGHCGSGNSSLSHGRDGLNLRTVQGNSRHWRTVLAAYFLILAAIGFWPTPVDRPVQGDLFATLFWLHAHGVPTWFGYKFVEASANVLLFIPVGALAALSFPRNRWWQNAAIGVLASACMELGQSLFLDQRDPSPQDLVTNVSGTILGILSAHAILNFKKRQAQRLP